jgi:hypothetical protein
MQTYYCGTVGGMDAAVETTWMYLQRVLKLYVCRLPFKLVPGQTEFETSMSASNVSPALPS